VAPLTLGSLHHAILRNFIDYGYAPTHLQLCERFGVAAAAMTKALRDLEAYHGVVLHPHLPEVWIAHPFSAAPTLFCVQQLERRWWGNCAWCALGVAALVGGNAVTIHTMLGAEGATDTDVDAWSQRHAILRADPASLRFRPGMVWPSFGGRMAEVDR
jgi:Alkylmercury lyase